MTCGSAPLAIDKVDDVRGMACVSVCVCVCVRVCVYVCAGCEKIATTMCVCILVFCCVPEVCLAGLVQHCPVAFPRGLPQHVSVKVVAIHIDWHGLVGALAVGRSTPFALACCALLAALRLILGLSGSSTAPLTTCAGQTSA